MMRGPPLAPTTASSWPSGDAMMVGDMEESGCGQGNIRASVLLCGFQCRQKLCLSLYTLDIGIRKSGLQNPAGNKGAPMKSLGSAPNSHTGTKRAECAVRHNPM